jgi:hypothetical protein
MTVCRQFTHSQEVIPAPLHGAALARDAITTAANGTANAAAASATAAIIVFFIVSLLP